LAEEFAERMLRTMNEAALALMVSVGHRTGLFDVMAGMPAATSDEIASAAGLDERYVREWLAVMTTGRIVEHDAAAGSYALPAEHAAWLTRAAGMQNLATGMQYIALMAQVEDQIVECFRHGGGVPYSAFPRFQAVMAEDSGAVHDATLVDVTLPLVPGLIARLRDGIDVADVGCGSGHAVNLMAAAFPRSRFTGFDFSEAGIAAARAEAGRRGLANAGFEQRDAARLGETARFDFRLKLLQGQQSDRARWKRAVAFVNTGMGEAVGRAYVAKYFPPEAKAKIDALVAELQVALNQRIDRVAWMSAETKAKAHAKLAQFTVKIAYPAAVLAHAQNADGAKKFVLYLQNDADARAVFAKYGFIVGPPANGK